MKKTISLILVMALILCNVSFASEKTKDYILKTVTEPYPGTVGGEWSVIGLARSGAEVPEGYFENYYRNLKELIKKNNGVLHERKYTEYSRVVLALTAIGKDPSDVSGYNLLTPLGDFEKTIFQGINGPVWALIALDSKGYEIPVNADAKVQATREMYIEKILESQLPDGGWSLKEGKSDPDITGMVLQALSKYQDKRAVKSATEKALSCLSLMQEEDGGFQSDGVSGCESCVQVIIALCELGISISDSRFVKNGYTVYDGLLNYLGDDGFFTHKKEEKNPNLMSTEQAFCAVTALKRINDNNSSLYRMNDVKLKNEEKSIGLPGKSEYVKKTEITSKGKTFRDIENHIYKLEIEALASRGIINGKDEMNFVPDGTMSRAEFATIVTRALGIEKETKPVFSDVTPSDWFYGYVNTAYEFKIIKGVSDNRFNPRGTITKEEAAVMISRAAKLCGMNTEISENEARNILSAFTDYVKAAFWSAEAFAFVFKKGILSDDAMEIEPKKNVTRAEIADMLYNLLEKSELL